MIEIFFPENNCRYIALEDGVDTLNNRNADITPFKNLINEMYSKDLSRKVKAAKRARFNEGKFMGTVPPYGYMKCPTDKNLLIIDEETAPIVRRMFQMAKDGMGISKIRKRLTEEKIMRPGCRLHCRTGNYDNYFKDNEENRYTWSNNGVRGILRNPVYAGHLAGYKRPIPTMKSKKRLTAQPEDWPTILNTHEPIISQDDFDLVQKLIKSRRIEGESGYNNIFSGLIKCADCGYALASGHANRKKTDNAIENIVYTCNNYRVYGKSKCTSHSVEAVDVHQAVLGDIRKHASMAIKNNKNMLQKILDKVNMHSDYETKALSKELRKSKIRLEELDKLFMTLYEDKASQTINERNFAVLSSKYEDEQMMLDKRITEIETLLLEQENTTNNVADFIDIVKDYADLLNLTLPCLTI